MYAIRSYYEIDLEQDYRLTGVGRAYGPPLNYQGTFPYLYRNNGDGTFTDVTKEAGVWRADGRGMGATALDYDGDGRLV